MVADLEQVSTAKHPQTNVLHKKTLKESKQRGSSCHVKQRGSSCHVMPINASLVSVCSAPAS